MWRMWKVPGLWWALFTRHQQMHGEPSYRIVECSHFSRRHYGDRFAPRRRHTRRRKLRSGPAGAHGSARVHRRRAVSGCFPLNSLMCSGSDCPCQLPFTSSCPGARPSLDAPRHWRTGASWCPRAPRCRTLLYNTTHHLAAMVS
jgi:hypothetical protein